MFSYFKKHLFVSATFLVLLTSNGFSQETVEEVFQRGVKLEKEREYDGALWELNKAMGMVKNNYNHPLRDKIEEAIRVTKGKLVVSRYASRRRLPENPENTLDVLSNEPNDFVVQQVFGKVLARGTWENRDNLIKGDFVGIGRTVTVLPDAGIELAGDQSLNFSLRCVQAASFSLQSEGRISLHSGSYCIHTLQQSSGLQISSPLVDLEINSDQPFAFMVGVTTNGGMKLICLLGRINLVMNDREEEILPGQLVFCLPEEFSRKMDVELETLMITSKLLNSFPNPVVFHKKLKQQALLQALRTKNRYRSTVGDVRGNKNFEVNVFPED